MAQLVICLQCRRPWFDSWVGKIPWRRNRLPIPVFLGFPGGSDGRESVRNEGDLGLIPVLGRSPRGRHGNPLQYSRLENPMDRGAWWAIVSPQSCKESDMTEQLSTTSSYLSFRELTMMPGLCLVPAGAGVHPVQPSVHLTPFTFAAMNPPRYSASVSSQLEAGKRQRSSQVVLPDTLNGHSYSSSPRGRGI